MNRLIALVLAASVLWLAAAQASAQEGAGDGCDGAEEKGVTVPCAGFDFCTCASMCENNSECTSECCSSGLCVPACVCEGESAYSLCDVGELPSGERESEPGGCAAVSHNDGFGNPALIAVALLSLFTAAWRRRQKGSDRERP